MRPTKMSVAITSMRLYNLYMDKDLELCVRLESSLSDVYLKLSNLFPEASDLFRSLSYEEARHADILRNVDTSLIPRPFLEKLCQDLREPVLSIVSMKDKIDQGEITLREALELSWRVETSGAEHYMNVALMDGHSAEGRAFLSGFVTINNSHAAMIDEAMKRLT